MLLAVLALIYIAALCTLGIFHKAYRDNILQQWGLVMAALACMGLISHITRYDGITWPCGLMLAGLVMFATGTAGKVVYFHRKRKAKNGPINALQPARVHNEPDSGAARS